MKRYEAWIEIISPDLTMTELSALVGLAPDEESSHARGDQKPLDRGTFERTLWRHPVGPPRKALDLIANDLRHALEQTKFDDRTTWPAGTQVRASIAQYFDDAYTTLELPSDLLQLLASLHLPLEIVCYPCSRVD